MTPFSPLLLGWLLLAAEPSPTVSSPAGYLPTGSPVELYELGRLALLRDPRARTIGFRSARQEEGVMILAEIEGPGIVQRLWFTPSSAERPEIGERRAERLRIYLDGQSRAVLDVALDDFLAGKHPRFPGPMVGESAGGFVCYVPIAFRKGCKVVVGGKVAPTYQIDVLTPPTADGLTTLTETPTETDRAALKLARALWLEPQALWSNEPSYSRKNDWKALSLLKKCDEAEYNVDGARRGSQLFLLPAGPRTVRVLEVVPTPRTADAWRSARLRVIWDGNDPDEAGVDLPVGLAYGQADRSAYYRSLLIGQNEMTWYNQFPMPYRRQALVRIDSDEPIKGVLRVRTLEGVEPNAGYFRGRVADSNQPWLNERGRGHLAGVFMAAVERCPKSPGLNGKHRLVVDGAPAGSVLEHSFNGGWIGVKGRLDLPQCFPLSGFPVLRQDGETSHVTAYRWRLADPVPFARSIEAGVERGAVPSSTADVRAAVFWYSERPGPSRPGR